MPSSAFAAALAERRDSAPKCAVFGCHHPAQGIGRYCTKHDATDYRTGHPQGRTIRFSEVAPFVDKARRFIADHRDHPGIVAACKWLASLIANAEDLGAGFRCITPQQKVDRFLAKMHREGIQPETMLALVAGMVAMRSFDARKFRNDRHFNHQLVTRFIGLVPAPRFADGSRRYDRTTVRGRDYLASRLMKALGLLTSRIAKVIVDRMSAPDPDIINGAHIPFNGEAENV